MASSRVTISMLDLPPILRFISEIGQIADRAAAVELSGVEVGSELNSALERLAEKCNEIPEAPDA